MEVLTIFCLYLVWCTLLIAGTKTKAGDEDESEVLRLQCNSLNLSSRGGRNTLAIRLFQHFNTNPSLLAGNDTDPVNFTAPAALLPEDTVPSESISTSPLAKRKKRASPQTSTSTSTKQPDKITAEEPPLTISTLRNELRTLLQTVVQQQIPAVSTPPSLTVPSFTPISTASTTMHVVPANQRTALPSFERNSDVLPPLPENMLLKIQQGKFVNFDLLLPQAFAPSTTDDYVLQVSNEGEGGILLYFASTPITVKPSENQGFFILAASLVCFC